MNPALFHPSSPAAARTRARRGEGELLRDEILTAAERLLIETGDEDAVSIRAIADAVGVTPPSIYLHFPDKETLLFGVCERQFAIFRDALDTAARTTNDPVEALERRAEAYVSFGLEHPEAYRIMFMGRAGLMERHAESVEKGAGAFTDLVDDVERAREAGAIREDIDSQTAAIFLWTGAHGITSLLISAPHFPWGDTERLVRELCALKLRALRREPS
jgi:AcrR family transcriptional regulator